MVYIPSAKSGMLGVAIGGILRHDDGRECSQQLASIADQLTAISLEALFLGRTNLMSVKQDLGGVQTRLSVRVCPGPRARSVPEFLLDLTN